jgi:uncharacterized protein YbjT (DUF2867 family)
MKVLVTGGTGNVGGAVVNELLKRGAEVRVLARKQPEPSKLPAEVEIAIGDLLDPVSVEKAMQGVDKLFLLNAVVTDELTQALIAYGIAKRVGIRHLTYLRSTGSNSSVTSPTSPPSWQSSTLCASLVFRIRYCVPATTSRTMAT